MCSVLYTSKLEEHIILLMYVPLLHLHNMDWMLYWDLQKNRTFMHACRPGMMNTIVNRLYLYFNRRIQVCSDIGQCNLRMKLCMLGRLCLVDHPTLYQ